MLKQNKTQLSTFVDGKIKVIPINTYFVEQDGVYRYRLGDDILEMEKDIVEKSAEAFVDADVSKYVKHNFFQSFDKEIDAICQNYFETILGDGICNYAHWKSEFIKNYILSRFGEIKQAEVRQAPPSTWKQLFFKEDNTKIETKQSAEWDVFAGNNPPLNFKLKIIK